MPRRGHPVHNGVHPGLKGPVGGAGDLFIGADLPQHSSSITSIMGREKGQVDRGYQVHLEAGVHIVAVLVVVGQDGHVGIARVIQGLAQQGAVMGQAAVADVTWP